MRAFAFVIGILLVVASLGWAVWIETETVALAYEVRRLRERRGEIDNIERILDAGIATRSTYRALTAAAVRLGIGADLDGIVTPDSTVPIPRTRPGAAE